MATLPRPTNVEAFVTSVDEDALTCDISVSWVIEDVLHPGPYTVTLQRRTDSGAWATIQTFVTYDAPTTMYADDGLTADHLYGYRAYWYCADCGLTSPLSAEGDIGAYLAAPTDTITLTDEAIVTHDPTSSEVFCYETLTLTEGLTLDVDYAVTITDTITLTDIVIAGSTLKTNYGFYFGTVDGDIHRYSSTYDSDNGTAILVRWRSKETDFADQYPQYLDHMKWIDRVRLVYVDKDASTPVSVKVSTDGGTTWTTRSASVGTGSGAVKDHSFWFNVSGRYFQFEVESSSASTTLQWISLEPQFLATAEYWEV